MTLLQTISSIQRKAPGVVTKVERYNGWSCPPPLVHSSSDHQALNTEDNNPPQSNYAQQRPKFRRNSFRAFLLKARNGDTAGWHFG